MGYELTVFVIMTILLIIGALAQVFNYKPKVPISERKRTAFGLVNLTLAGWAVVTLLILGGWI